jgi:hypothetical protein
VGYRKEGLCCDCVPVRRYRVCAAARTHSRMYVRSVVCVFLVLDKVRHTYEIDSEGGREGDGRRQADVEAVFGTVNEMIAVQWVRTTRSEDPECEPRVAADGVPRDKMNKDFRCKCVFWIISLHLVSGFRFTLL